MADLSKLKCVNVGDTGVGKTCVLISFTENEFPEEHVPTAFDNYSSIIEYESKTYTVNLWDTSGQDNDSMRPLSYNDTNVFIVYFSLVDRNSFERLSTKWIPEIVQNTKTEVPFILVGNKMDLRDDPQAMAALGITQKPITTEEGKAMAEKVNALSYVECSAKTQAGLGEVFNTAVAAVVDPQKLLPQEQLEKLKSKKKKGCKNQ